MPPQKVCYSEVGYAFDNSGQLLCGKAELTAWGCGYAYWHTVLQELVAEVDCYDPVVEANSAYIDPAITPPQEVFAHLQTIEYTPQNAFLLKRR